MEALLNRVRKPIGDTSVIWDLGTSIVLDYLLLRLELEDIKREVRDIFFLQLRFLMRHLTMEKRVEFIENQLEKLRERLSKTSTELSKGNMNDSDAGIIDRESSDGSLDEVKSFYAYACARFDEITAKHWLKLWDDPRSCEELVDKVWYAVVVSTVALLSIVYQYLLGYLLKGGTKAYSSGSLDFRDTFVSLLLFQGSYVWIFFRAVAPRKIYRRSKKDEAGRVLCYYGKYEPRFKPPREKLPGGTSIKFDHLPLGGYDSERDAKIVCQIAGFYYVKDEGRIQLRDGSYFTIPAVPEQEQSLCGKERAQWVAARAKEVFRDFQLMNNAINLPSESNAVGGHDYFQHVVTEEFSLDAFWDAADAHPVDLEFVDSLCAVGEGLEGTVTPPSSSDLNFFDSLIAVREGSEGSPASPSDEEQVVLRIMERPQSLDMVSNDADSMTMQESITQQLKEHLEAIDRRIAEQHEQHLQREKQLEERISQLERNSKLQNLEDEYVRSFLC